MNTGKQFVGVFGVSRGNRAVRHFESSVELRKKLRNVKERAGRRITESIQVLCYRSRFLFCRYRSGLMDRT